MTKKGVFNFFCLLVLASFLILQVGCASFPPPHDNSFYTKNETVTVKMLTCAELTDYKKDWEKSFKPVNISYPCPPPEDKKDRIPIVIGIAAPLAFNYVKTKLQQETENYVQQFGGTYFRNDFWIKKEDEYKQKYYGFEIVRKAQRYNDESAQKSSHEEVFTLVYGLAEDTDGFFWAAPLYFKTNKAKAKVSSWGSKHKIDTMVEIKIDSVWKDDKGKYHKENIANFDPFTVKNYDIDAPEILRTSCNNKNADTCSPLEGGINSFAGVPISYGSSATETGKFWLIVGITESDTAKTKKYISNLSDILDKNKDKVIDLIKKKAGN